ncbi:MAG: L,D-transpeptidase [Methylococcales bacterium]|nr:L,D-transpeptidase [Methylococcales bacterium]
MDKIQFFQVLLLIFTFFSSSLYADDSIWLLIDTHKLNLKVKKGTSTLAVMNNISIGRGGAGFKQYKGDDITPLGTYKISWINKKSRFRKFYGFNYPSIDNTSNAFKNNLLSSKSYTSIMNAHKKNKVPPQNTSLGGVIGIHGLGNADKKIHELVNWTHGCIAVTNQQIDILAKWLNKGMLVKIK